MVNRHTALKIRKTHRYLGLFLGIQFLFWTISGLYFSWTNIDEIHGDQFKNLKYQPKAFNSLISPSEMDVPNGIKTIELRDIDNDSLKVSSQTSGVINFNDQFSLVTNNPFADVDANKLSLIDKDSLEVNYNLIRDYFNQKFESD